MKTYRFILTHKNRPVGYLDSRSPVGEELINELEHIPQP